MPEPSGDDYARVKAELLAVLALSAEAADAHLAQLARAHPGVAARVRDLLKAHHEAGDFLAVPESGVAWPVGPDPVDVPEPSVAGRRIGPFTVERVIGRKLRVAYAREAANAEDITFDASVLPAAWTPSDIRWNIGILYRQAMSAGLINPAGRLAATRRATSPSPS